VVFAANFVMVMAEMSQDTCPRCLLFSFRYFWCRDSM